MRLFYAMCICLVVDIDYAMPIDTIVGYRQIEICDYLHPYISVAHHVIDMMYRYFNSVSTPSYKQFQIN